MSTDPETNADGSEPFGIDHPTVVPENSRQRTEDDPNGDS